MLFIECTLSRIDLIESLLNQIGYRFELGKHYHSG